MFAGTNVFSQVVIALVLPPALGVVVGLLLGLAASRKWLGASCGAMGGFVGAWLGIAAYWSNIVPTGQSLPWLMVLYLIGCVSGAVIMSGLPLLIATLFLPNKPTI
ncbi:hypothetical protein BH10PLA2_BH10PLA2_22870 [soil metagenome]